METRTPALVALLSLALLTVGASGALAVEPEDPGQNGIVMMVHGHFEPAVTDQIPPPPAQEAFLTTQQNGEIILRVIPYDVETQKPIVVDEATVAIEGQLPGQSVILEPEAPATDDARCIDETDLPDHEGPLEACMIVRVDAETVRGWGAVEVELRANVGDELVVEPYSSPAHLAMHTTMEDGAPGFDTADQLSGVTTPFLIEDLVDPVQPVS